MKKILTCVISALVLCTVLAACGNGRVDDNANVTASPIITSQPGNSPLIDGGIDSGIDGGMDDGIADGGNAIIEDDNGTTNANGNTSNSGTVSPSPSASAKS